MRTITYEEEQGQQQPQTPVPADDSIHDHFDQQDASLPHRSVPDSPLSHKSFQQGTPRRESTGDLDLDLDLDLTFDMNEASMLVSTPYMPRNTKLDDIREREMESLREQRVAIARLDRMHASARTTAIPSEPIPWTRPVRSAVTIPAAAASSDVRPSARATM